MIAGGAQSCHHHVVPFVHRYEPHIVETCSHCRQIGLDGNDKAAHDFAQRSEAAARSSVAGEDSILNTINPLHGLGECVIETTLAANPLPPPQPPPDVPTFSLRICMCGRTLTGKSEQAIRLADRYCLKVRLLVEQYRNLVVKKIPLQDTTFLWR